jgi:hypothetical protein
MIQMRGGDQKACGCLRGGEWGSQALRGNHKRKRVLGLPADLSARLSGYYLRGLQKRSSSACSKQRPRM